MSKPKSERWLTQTEFHSETTHGNCTETCLASILGIPLSEVPTLHKDGEPNSSGFWERFNDFLESKGYKAKDIHKHLVWPGYWLASGLSPRGVYHMVIMKDDKLFHDPHPSRAGIDSVVYSWLLVPLDPCLDKERSEDDNA